MVEVLRDKIIKDNHDLPFECCRDACTIRHFDLDPFRRVVQDASEVDIHCFKGQIGKDYFTFQFHVFSIRMSSVDNLNHLFNDVCAFVVGINWVEFYRHFTLFSGR